MKIKEGGGMDIQKERELCEVEFEKEWDYFCEAYGNGYNKSVAKYFFFKAWQAAKAQAVPETQQALNDRLLVKSIREHVESHIAEISVNDLFDKGWLAAMKCIQNNIDMLEAQEPAND